MKFKDRLARDLFVCQVMNQVRIKIPEISSLFTLSSPKNRIGQKTGEIVIKSSIMNSKLLKSQVMARASVNGRIDE